MSLAGCLEALEFVQGLIEAALYGRLVAGELREGVCLVCIPDKGSAERGGLRVLLDPHLLSLLEGLPVLAPIGYCGVGGY